MENVRKAKLTDAKKIKVLADTLEFGNLIEKNGFLVSRFTLDDYEKIISQNSIVYIYESDSNQILGFLIAFKISHGNFPIDIKIPRIIREITDGLGEYIIIKQIAVHPDAQKRGVATKLYEYFFDQYDKNEVFTVIVSEPQNKPSQNFHIQFGFSKLAQSKSLDNSSNRVFRSDVWYRSSPFYKSNTEIELESDLLENYALACKLYCHEDSLNWRKLQLLVTAVLALTLGFWVVIENINGALFGASTIFIFTLLSVALAVFGFGLIRYLNQKIKSGIRFMQSHKFRVRVMEAKLFNDRKGFFSLVSTLPAVADTIKIMNRVGVFVLLYWSVLSGFMIYHVIYLIFENYFFMPAT